MLKKNLLLLITELVFVVLNYSGIIRLWKPQNMTNFVTPNILPSSSKIYKYIFYLKIKKSANTWQILRTLPCGLHKCMVLYLVLWYEFFSVLEKITILLFERNKLIIKTLLKDISRLSVRVNSISDGIRWNFIWQNAINVYYTKKKLPPVCQIFYFIKFRVTCIVIVM